MDFSAYEFPKFYPQERSAQICQITNNECLHTMV